MSPRKRILDTLPIDILCSICAHLTVEDILLLKQTCRSLYTFGCTDYVWHQLTAKLPFPLDLPPNTTISQLPAAELQRIVIRGMRLDYNWRQPSSRVRNLIKACNMGTIVDQMCLLPGQWLLTLFRGGTLTLWSLKDLENVYRVSEVVVDGCRKFFAALDDSGDGAMVVLFAGDVFGVREHIHIYAFRLEEPPGGKHTPPAKPRLVLSIPRPGDHGYYYSASICADHVAAASIVADDVPLRIVLANVSTGVWTVLGLHHPTLLVSTVTITLHPQYLTVIAREASGRYFAQIHDLTSAYLSSTATHDTAGGTVVELPAIARKSYTEWEPARVTGQTHAYDERRGTHTTLEFVHNSEGFCAPHIYRHSIDFSLSSEPETSPIHRAAAKINQSTPRVYATDTLAQLGITGHRAVWMRRDWGRDEFTLMKMTCGPELERSTFDVGVLLRSSEAPFVFSSFHSIAFDEATGRLCLALYDGDIWVIDF